MQVSIRTSVEIDGSQVTVHIVGTDGVGHLMWFENEQFDLGEIPMSQVEEIVKLHRSQHITWVDSERAFLVTN